MVQCLLNIYYCWKHINPWYYMGLSPLQPPLYSTPLTLLSLSVVYFTLCCVFHSLPSVSGKRDPCSCLCLQLPRDSKPRLLRSSPPPSPTLLSFLQFCSPSLCNKYPAFLFWFSYPQNLLNPTCLFFHLYATLYKINFRVCNYLNFNLDLKYLLQLLFYFVVHFHKAYAIFFSKQ